MTVAARMHDRALQNPLGCLLAAADPGLIYVLLVSLCNTSPSPFFELDPLVEPVHAPFTASGDVLTDVTADMTSPSSLGNGGTSAGTNFDHGT